MEPDTVIDGVVLNQRALNPPTKMTPGRLLARLDDAWQAAQQALEEAQAASEGCNNPGGGLWAAQGVRATPANLLLMIERIEECRAWVRGFCGRSAFDPIFDPPPDSEPDPADRVMFFGLGTIKPHEICTARGGFERRHVFRVGEDACATPGCTYSRAGRT